jgi:hypothetical protein
VRFLNTADRFTSFSHSPSYYNPTSCFTKSSPTLHSSSTGAPQTSHPLHVVQHRTSDNHAATHPPSNLQPSWLPPQTHHNFRAYTYCSRQDPTQQPTPSQHPDHDSSKMDSSSGSPLHHQHRDHDLDPSRLLYRVNTLLHLTHRLRVGDGIFTYIQDVQHNSSLPSLPSSHLNPPKTIYSHS